MAFLQKQAGTVPFNTIREIIADKADIDISHVESSPDKCLFHLIFHAKTDDIINDGNLSKAYLVALRIIQHDAEGKLISYEVRIDNQTMEHEYNGKNYGTFLEEENEIIKAMEENEQLDGLEHAFLRLSALRIKAIWFRAKERECDYFIPLSPAFYNLTVGKLYTANEFVPVLIQAAKQITLLISNNIGDDLLGG